MLYLYLKAPIMSGENLPRSWMVEISQRALGWNMVRRGSLDVALDHTLIFEPRFESDSDDASTLGH